jgi:hypothetical protein
MQPSPMVDTSRPLFPSSRFCIFELLSFAEPWIFSGRAQPRYCSSLTRSSQSTTLPSRRSWMAMWVMAVVGEAPCQCFSPGENQITSSVGNGALIGPEPRRAGQCLRAFGQADIFSIHSDKRRRSGGIRAVSRARIFSKLFPVLRIGIAFDAFKYYVRREPGLVCMVPDDRLKILFRMLSLFKAFIDPNIGVGLHHSF